MFIIIIKRLYSPFKSKNELFIRIEIKNCTDLNRVKRQLTAPQKIKKESGWIMPDFPFLQI